MLYKENNAIFKSYLNRKVMYLSEEEQQKEQVKAQVFQALNNPQTQQALEKSADQLLAKYSEQIQQVKQQGPQAIAKLLQQIEAEVRNIPTPNQGATQPVQEGVWNRAVSNVAGIGRSIKGKDDAKTNALNKRFEILQNEIGKDLRELKMDLGHSSQGDNTVKQQVDQMIQTLGAPTGGAAAITPAADTNWSKFRNSAGHLVTGAIPGVAIAALVSPLIGAFGLSGMGLVGAKAATSAGTAALLSVINDKLNDRPVEWGTAAKKAGVAAAATFTFGAVNNYLHSGGTPAPTSGGGGAAAGNAPVDTSNLNVKGNFMYNQPGAHVTPGVASIGPTGDEFANLHGSVANAASSLDSAKQALADILRDKGVVGVSKGMSGVASPHIMNAMDVVGKTLGHKLTTADYSAISQWVQQQDPEILKNLAKGGQKALVSSLLKAVKGA